jgi:hypothetical protein
MQREEHRHTGRHRLGYRLAHGRVHRNQFCRYAEDGNFEVFAVANECSMKALAGTLRVGE